MKLLAVVAHHSVVVVVVAGGTGGGGRGVEIAVGGGGELLFSCCPSPATAYLENLAQFPVVDPPLQFMKFEPRGEIAAYSAQRAARDRWNS